GWPVVETPPPAAPAPLGIAGPPPAPGFADGFPGTALRPGWEWPFDRPPAARVAGGELALRCAGPTAVVARQVPLDRYAAVATVGTCTKDDSCVEVCPVDCIHPKPGAPDFETAEQLYIDPGVCIDCDACVEACPVDAIFPDFELPAKFDYALDLNAEFFAEAGTAERTAA